MESEHKVKAVLLEGAIRNKKSRHLMSRGSFHIFALDKLNNPLNKHLKQTSVAILYMPGFNVSKYRQLNTLPKYRCVVAAINPDTYKWINGKPNLRAIYGILKKDRDRKGNIVKNLWDFARAVYHLLFIEGEYRYREL